MRNLTRISLSIVACIFVGHTAAQIEESKLLASDLPAGAYFGSSAAMCGRMAVVGARYASGGIGAVYTFPRSDSSWPGKLRLAPSVPIGLDEFGYSVALSNTTLAVAARQGTSRPPAESRGAAYVFVDSDGSGNWVQQARLASTEAGPFYSTALLGDALAVGKPFALPEGVVIFAKTGPSWYELVNLRSDSPLSAAEFGYSVAADENTLVVGAPADDYDGANPPSGSAYVFERNGISWQRQAKLKATDLPVGAFFGGSVAICSNRIVVGALGASTGRGAAYVFSRANGGWNQGVKIIAADGVANDQFGQSVAISESGILVGAPNESRPFKTGTGAVYSFSRTGESWTQRAKIFAADAAPEDRFGSSVALSVDSAVIGAQIHGSTGAAYAFTFDRDRDGLLDEWETDGIDADQDGTIDLVLENANFEHKDLYVEIDAMTGYGPDQDALTRVEAAFAAAPGIANPDSKPGITLHLQPSNYDIPPVDWTDLVDSHELGYTAPCKDEPDIPYWPREFDVAKASYFSKGENVAAKALAYRYCIFGKTYSLKRGASGGVAKSIPGAVFAVTLGHPNWSTRFEPSDLVDLQAAMLMHELGHALGLRHGGRDCINNKPNYFSVMNYTWNFRFPMSGVGSCAGLQQYRNSWRLDYSREELPLLYEGALGEAAGIGGDFGRYVRIGPPNSFSPCPSVVAMAGSVDWNDDGDSCDNGVPRDINRLNGPRVKEREKEFLFGHNDWAAPLVYGPVEAENVAANASASSGGGELTPEEIVSMAWPLEGDFDTDCDVDLSDLGIVLSSYGTSTDGDWDGNGETDLADLGIVLSNYGEVCP